MSLLYNICKALNIRRRKMRRKAGKGRKMVAKVKDGGGKIENKEYTKMNPHKIRQRMSGKLIFRM